MLIQSQQAQKKGNKLSADLDDLKISESVKDAVVISLAKEPPATSENNNKSEGATENLVKEEIMDQDQVETDKSEKKDMSTHEERKLKEKETVIGVDPKDSGIIGDEAEDGDGEREEDDDDDQEEISIDPRTYCKLGHFHLLLEDYAKGEEDMENDQWSVD